MSTFLITTLVVTLAISTLLPLSENTRWWIRDLDFPRLQIAIAASILIVVELLLLSLSEPQSLVLVSVTVACLIYQLWWILPYTRIYSNQVKTATRSSPANRIRIMTANVLTPNRNAAGLIALIRQHSPDILVTLESDEWWQEKLDVIEDTYHFTMKCPLDNLYGMHVYSMLPLEDCAIQFLVEDHIPSMHAIAVMRSGEKVRMHFLHPTPPSPTEHEASTQRDAELLAVAKSVAELRGPVIVAGDLNDVAWSTTTRLFRKISGLLDPRVGRGMYNTFHANYWFMRWPLDHLFHSSHFTLSFIQRLPRFGSDHFPVLVELVHDSSRREEQRGLDADGDDHQLADKKINAESVNVADVHEPAA